MFKENNYSLNSVKGILAAYLILVLHVVLVAIIGFLVLFFSGIMKYVTMLFLGSILIIFIMCFYIYKKIKKSVEMGTRLNLESKFYNQPMEITFLGGLASFKLKPSLRLHNKSITNSDKSLSQLNFYNNSKINDIAKLANLLEKKLITIAEYNKAKRDILYP